MVASNNSVIVSSPDVASCAGQNEPLFLRTYTGAEGEEDEDANLRLHDIVHSSLDVVSERKGAM